MKKVDENNMSGKEVKKLVVAAGHPARVVNTSKEYVPMHYGEFRRLWRKFRLHSAKTNPAALDSADALVDFVVRHRRPVPGETPIFADEKVVVVVSPGPVVMNINPATGWIPMATEQEVNVTGGDKHADAERTAACADCSDAVPSGA